MWIKCHLCEWLIESVSPTVGGNLSVPLASIAGPAPARTQFTSAKGRISAASKRARRRGRTGLGMQRRRAWEESGLGLS